MAEEQPAPSPNPSGKTWVDVQKKTFTRWANNFLSDRLLKIEDLTVSLQDGILLINLLEILSSKQIPKYNKKCTMKPQKLENVSTALAFIKKEGLKLVAIGPEDVVDGNLKLILGLIWTLILRFQIQRGDSEGSPKWELLEWVKKQVKPYGLTPKNFTMDWIDGKLLSALTDSLKPGVIDIKNLSRDALKDTDHAMDVAHTEYGIPKIIDAQDMVDCPDELSVMTYVSYFRDWALNDGRRREAELEAERLRKLKTADPSQCYAHGPGLEGGSTNNDAPFKIQAVNYFGDPLPTGGDEFFVSIEGPESPICNIHDNNNGTHDAAYRPTLPGDYTITINLRGEPIKGSPYGPARIRGPDVTTSHATGPGVEGARVKGAAPFKIHSKDKNGNLCPHGGDPFAVKVTDPSGKDLPVSLNDNNNGTYDGSYNPATPGHYKVEVTLKGEHIKGSPYHPLIELGNPAKSWAEGDGLTGGKTDHPLHIKIHAVDGDGNPVREGGDPFKVNISGPEQVTPQVHDNGDGTYDVEYSVGTPGDYTVKIDLHDQPIKDSPFHPHVKPSADASKSYAEGPGLTEAFDNEPAHFTIHAKDKQGNPRKDGGDPFKVNISGPETVVPQVVDNGDGTYAVTYEAGKPGPYRIEVTLEDKPIKDAPFSVNVKEGTDASNSGFAVFSFTVQTRDKHNKNKSFGGDLFEVRVAGPTQVEVNTSDHGDGTYSASYHLVERGSYQLNVLLNGKDITGSPLKQQF